jgi:hypothetical protein
LGESPGGNEGPSAPPNAGVPSGEQDESTQQPGSTQDDSKQERGATTELSLVESETTRGGSAAASELLRAMSQLMQTLNSERKELTVGAEKRRAAEVENARLAALLETEHELRRRAEEELERLKAEALERRQRAQAELDRIAAQAGIPRPSDLLLREIPGPKGQPPPPPPRARSARSVDAAADAGARSGSHGQASAADGPPTMEGPQLSGGPQVPDGLQLGGKNGPAARAGPRPQPPEPGGPVATFPRTGRAGEAAIEQLPPGWKYASELPDEKPRWRRFWQRRTSPS